VDFGLKNFDFHIRPISIFLVFNHDVVIDFTYVAASNTATDDVTN